jgi:adenylate cyclase
MCQFRKISFLPYIATCFVSGIVFIIIIGIRSAGYLEYLELMTYDWFIRMQPVYSSPSKSIVVIGINEDDIQKNGRWPISDATLAQALDYLVRYKPRTIGLDLFRDLRVPPGSKEFESVLEENKNIIAVMKFGNDGVSSPKAVRETYRIGFNDILVDRGGIIRRGLLFLDDDEQVYSSFALQLALQYLKVDGIFPQPDKTNPQYIALGNTTIPPIGANEGGYVETDDRGYQFLIDFKREAESFQIFSLTSLLSSQIPQEKITDKVVLIGVMAHSVKDYFYTPLSRGIRSGQQIPGVIIHAQLTDQLLRFALDGLHPIKSFSDRQEMLWILIWSSLGGIIAILIRSPLLFSIVVSLNITALFSITFFAFLQSLWIPLIPPAMSLVVSSAIITAYVSSREKNQRLLLMQLFSRHVSKEVADSIWQRREEFLNDGRPRPQKLTATILFSDLKGFTTLSEKLEPNMLVEWLNMYMEAMAQAVNNHGGIIDDYAGDGIKVNFGVPLPRNNRDEICQDAINAVNCALSMEKRMRELNNLCLNQNLPTTGIRIGICTGSVIAAALGSSNRLKFTTVGDTVNIASRLESYDKNFEKESLCRILIGDSTLSYLDRQFNTKMVGEEVLRGREGSIAIHRVLGRNKKNQFNS